MADLKIKVQKRIATAPRDAFIVSDNTEYGLVFDFDDEWGDDPKVARFALGLWRAEVAFNGSGPVRVPLLPAGCGSLRVGVCSGDLTTSAAAVIRVVPSIAAGGISESDAAEIERVRAEAERISNEAARQAAEAARQTAEAARQELAKQMQQAIADVSGAVEDAHKAVDQAAEATSAANAAVETANAAVETANMAAERATEAADSVEGVITDAFAATNAANTAAYHALAAAGNTTAAIAVAQEAARDAHDAAAEARAAVGDLDDLTTVNKASIVGAVNEVNAEVAKKASVDAVEALESTVEDVRNENAPIIVNYPRTTYMQFAELAQKLGPDHVYVLHEMDAETSFPVQIAQGRLEKSGVPGQANHLVCEALTYEGGVPTLVQYRLAPTGWTKNKYPLPTVSTVTGMIDTAVAELDSLKVKEVSLKINIELPSCTEDVPNASIPAVDVTLSESEAATFAIAGFTKYSLWDSETGANRLNAFSVGAFTMESQSKLRMRFVCAGSARKVARKAEVTLLLKRR